MKPEEIRDARELALDHFWTERDALDARHMIERLLDERARLLDALAVAAEFDPIATEDFGRLTTIRDALVFAEAAAWVP